MRRLVVLASLLAASVPVLALSMPTNASASTPPTNTVSVRHERVATELVKLKEAGLEAPVLIAYIHTARVPYSTTAADILFLHENKVAEEVIREWITQGSRLVAASAQAPARSPDLVAAYTPAVQQQRIVVQQTPTVVQSQPIVVTAPPVIYSSPAYVYSDYSSWAAPSVYLGVSYGWGWRRPFWSGWGYSPHGYYGSWRGWGGHGYGFRGGYGGHGVYRAGFSGGGHFGGGHRR